MKTLISMIAFIRKQQKSMPIQKGFVRESWESHFVRTVINYSIFLERPLTLGMFVPCGENGNVLKEPPYFTEWENDEEFIFSIEGVGKKCVEFNEAKEKVLFKGFSIREEKRKKFVSVEGYEIEISMLPKIKMKIEDLANDWNHIELTESAIKQIGL